MVFFDPYVLVPTDEMFGSYVETYYEVADVDQPSLLQCYVSFDGTVPSIPVTIGAVFAIGAPGNNFRIKFTNVSGSPERRYVGSYALLY